MFSIVILVQFEKKNSIKNRFSNKNYADYLQGEMPIFFKLLLQIVKKLFPLYPHSMIRNLLVQIVYRQEY